MISSLLLKTSRFAYSLKQAFPSISFEECINTERPGHLRISSPSAWSPSEWPLSLEHFSAATTATVWYSTALGTASTRQMHGQDFSHSVFVLGGALIAVIAAALRGRKGGLRSLIYYHAPFGVICGLICLGAWAAFRKLIDISRKTWRHYKSPWKLCTPMHAEDGDDTECEEKSSESRYTSVAEESGCKPSNTQHTIMCGQE